MISSDLISDVAADESTLVVLTASPPCVDVAQLRADAGSRGECGLGLETSKVIHVQRIWRYLRSRIPHRLWGLIECTSMPPAA